MNILYSARQITTAFALATAVRSATAQGLPRARPETVGLSSAALQRIGPALRAMFVDSNQAAGIVVAVARHGKPVYFDTIGSMDIERAAPMRSNAVFRIMSMTKPITATAVMQLVERGKVRLDDPVAKYIPAFARMKVQTGGTADAPILVDADRPITIEQLLTHTSGLTYAGRARPVFGRAATIGEFADSLATVPLLFQPGTAWSYSFAADVLVRVIEVASGKSFDRYLEEEIFAPLGMHQTGFHQTPAMDGLITIDYARTPEGTLKAPAQILAKSYLPESRFFAGGQGLLSTAPDYLRFAQMLLNGGTLDGHRVLQPASVTRMTTSQVPPAFVPTISKAIPDYLVGDYGFGYGGAVRVDSATSVPGSVGTYRWVGSHLTAFWVDRRADIVALVWTQRSNPNNGSLEHEFQRLVYAAVIGK